MKKLNDTLLSSGDVSLSGVYDKISIQSSYFNNMSGTSTMKTQKTNQSNENSEVDDDQWKNCFINNLRRVFQSIDINQEGKINLDQWMENKDQIKRFIRDGNLNDEEYKLYFWRIDANGCGFVTWDSLVQYLLRDISSTELYRGEQSIQFIQKTSKGVPLHENVHREMVKMITICESSSEYISLSSDSIRFWNVYDLQYKRSITEPGLFSSMLVFESHLKMAVATTNRRLLLYDIDSLNQLPCEISASPSPFIIKHMSQQDAKYALKNLQTTKLTLFNSPTCMLYAKYALSSQSTLFFFVGDDQGFIQTYQMIAPLRRKSPAYKIQCISKTRMHNDCITHMSLIESFNCYASSSCDKTVKFWQFDEKTKKLEILRVLKDHNEITGFKFLEKQKTVITCGISRDAFVWSLSPPQRVFKLGGHYNTVVAITDYITSTNEKYLLTMANRKEFRLWDPVSYRMVREWTDPSLLRPENRYSAIIYDELRHSIITAASYPIRWSENAELLENFLEQSTHKHSVVGCHYSKTFNQIVAVDSIGNFSAYNIKNGKLQSMKETEWNPEITDLSATTLDYAGRRLITCNYHNLYQMWNFNSGELLKIIELDDLTSSSQNNGFNDKKSDTEVDPKSLKAQMNPDIQLQIHQKEMMKLESLGTSKFGFSQMMKKNSITSCLEFFKIGGREFIVKGGWDKTVLMFTEVDYGSYSLFRRYNGHKGDISSIVSYKDGVISGSVNGEIFCWDIDTNNAQAEAVLQCKAGVEILHCFGGTHLIVGDSIGFISVFTVPKLQLIERFKAHGLILNHSISAIESDVKKGVIFTGDTFGYVKKWNITTAFVNHNISSSSSKSTLPESESEKENEKNKNDKVKTPPLKKVNFSSSNNNKSHVSFGQDLLKQLSRRGSIISKSCFNPTASSSLLSFFIMEPVEIHRCHNYDILSITLVDDGKFIVTSGADMNVRMFSAENFDYVGLFHMESEWNIDDISTWLIECKNVEYEKRHFFEEKNENKGENKKEEKSINIEDAIEIKFDYSDNSDDNDENAENEEIKVSSSSSNINVLSSNIDQIQTTGNNDSQKVVSNNSNIEPNMNSNQNNENDNENQEFSAQKTRDIIENFIDEEERRFIPYKIQLQRRLQMQSKKSPQIARKSHLMQTSMRPNELIAKVTQSLNLSWSGSSSKSTPKKDQAEMRQSVRLPIMTPRSFRKLTKRNRP